MSLKLSTRADLDEAVKANMNLTPRNPFDLSIYSPTSLDWTGWTWDYHGDLFVQLMSKAAIFIVGWLVVRTILLRYVFPHIAVACGIKARHARKTRKFCYQLWLACFYTGSSVFAYYLLGDRPWMKFPMDFTSGLYAFAAHPYTPEPELVLYYAYAIGFYCTEMASIFTETKRSDFTEYVIHHIATLVLMIGSGSSYDLRIGTYVLLLHDIPDIFLSAAKVCHYAKEQIFVNVFFVGFVVTLMFFRLFCLPCASYIIFCVAPVMRTPTFAYWSLNYFLTVVLQSLHIYWFFLTVKMCWRLATGVKGDVRSSDDEDEVEERVNSPKNKKKTK